jgi:hypothetical protein
MPADDIIRDERERMRRIRIQRMRAILVSRSIVSVCDDYGTPVGMVWREARQWHTVSSLPCPHYGDLYDEVISASRDDAIEIVLERIKYPASSMQ